MNQMWPPWPLNCTVVYEYRSDPSVAGCSDILTASSGERNCELLSFFLNLLNLVLLIHKEGDGFACFRAPTKQQKAP